MKVLFNRLAEAELIAAARYLDAERGLGSAFLDEYEAWEKQLRAFPESCPEISTGIRCGFLARFKYHVTYLSGPRARRPCAGGRSSEHLLTRTLRRSG